jgi:rRNA biogenesis protein RRP5
MGSIKRKADAPAKKEKAAAPDRSVKRQRKSDVADAAPAKPKPETAPPKSVFKDEEKSFPRGGASVLTPLEHKQIQIKANQDVLFEQTGGTRTGDMGSEDGDKAKSKAAKKWPSKKGKKQDDGEKELVVRAEGLNYKVRHPLRTADASLTAAETHTRYHNTRSGYRHHPPGRRTCPAQ